MKVVRQTTLVEYEKHGDFDWSIKRKGNIITRFTIIPREPIGSVQSDKIQLDIVLRHSGVEIPFDVYMEDVCAEVGIE